MVKMEPGKGKVASKGDDSKPELSKSDKSLTLKNAETFSNFRASNSGNLVVIKIPESLSCQISELATRNLYSNYSLFINAIGKLVELIFEELGGEQRAMEDEEATRSNIGSVKRPKGNKENDTTNRNKSFSSKNIISIINF